jgi:thiamine biosynthesis lipoprotein
MQKAWKFEALGTPWVITTQTELSLKIKTALSQRIAEFDATYSRFRSDSLVAHIAQVAGAFALPADASRLLKFYYELYKSTDGLVTPLIGQLMADLGYDAHYSFEAKSDPAKVPEWSEVLTYTKVELTTTQPALLDFGAAGKGYLVDIIGEMIESFAVTDYVINASGDIRHRAAHSQSIVIGLENPLQRDQVVGTVKLDNQSLCASSGSKRTWGKYHHIVNPDTATSPQEILATWVIADDTITADGLATALFFTPVSKLRKSFGFSHALLKADMSLEYDKSFPVKTFQEVT